MLLSTAQAAQKVRYLQAALVVMIVRTARMHEIVQSSTNSKYDKRVPPFLERNRATDRMEVECVMENEESAEEVNNLQLASSTRNTRSFPCTETAKVAKGHKRYKLRGQNAPRWWHKQRKTDFVRTKLKSPMTQKVSAKLTKLTACEGS